MQPIYIHMMQQCLYNYKIDDLYTNIIYIFSHFKHITDKLLQPVCNIIK